MYFDYTKVCYMDKNNILYQEEYILMCAFLISYSDDLHLKTMTQPDQKIMYVPLLLSDNI